MKTSLAEAYLAGNEQVLSLFHFPFSPQFHFDDWKRVIAERRKRPVQKWSDDSLTSLRQYNAKSGCGEKTLKNILCLTEPETLVVATGQQPGVLGGPLYNLYKALTAIKLAEALSSQFSMSVVPVFWLASDDHDFEEVRHFYWIDTEGKLASFSYSPPDYQPGLPLFAISVDSAQFDELFGQLKETTYETEYKESILKTFKEIIADSKNFEIQFVRTLNWLLGDSGLIFIPPHLPEIRARALPLILKEIEHPGESSRLTQESAQKIRQLGFTPSLYRRQGQVNFFFLNEEGKRFRIDYHNGKFSLRLALANKPAEKNKITHRMNKESFLKLVSESPDKISFNVITRPLVQDLILPTIAYVAGDGEINYFAQLKAVYEHFDVFMPVIFPRPHLLIIEPRIKKVLDTYNIKPEEIFDMSVRALKDKICENVPETTQLPLIEQSHRDIKTILGRLAEELVSIQDTAVKDSLNKLQQYIETGFTRLRERYKNYLTLHDEIRQRHIEKLETALFPLGHLQERIYSPFFPYILNFGTNFLRLLHNSLNPFLNKQVLQL